MSNCVPCHDVFVVIFFKTMYDKKLLDLVFMISAMLIKVELFSASDGNTYLAFDSFILDIAKTYVHTYIVTSK